MPPTFFCTLCQKGYARAPELEAHENSYDHQHKKRLKEMKAMTRPTAASAFPRKRDPSDALMGANVKADPPPKRAGGFKPVGRVAAPATAAPPTAAGPVASTAAAERTGMDIADEQRREDEYVLITGPMPWEQLGSTAGELLDLDAARPRELQMAVDAQRLHMGLRRDPELYRGLWERVNAMRGTREGRSESPPPALGLGA